jgi:hypothetical protein
MEAGLIPSLQALGHTVREMPSGYVKPGGQPPWLCGLFALAEEDVICGIGDAAKGAGLIARALGGAAVGVDPLHGGDIRERPASASPWSTGAYDTPSALASSEGHGPSLFILRGGSYSDHAKRQNCRLAP